MLNRFGRTSLRTWQSSQKTWSATWTLHFGLIFSQRAMLTLIEKGMTREQAYDLVQPKTAQSWDNQVDFKPLLEADPVNFTPHSRRNRRNLQPNLLHQTGGWKSSNASVWVTNRNRRKGDLKNRRKRLGQKLSSLWFDKTNCKTRWLSDFYYADFIGIYALLNYPGKGRRNRILTVTEFCPSL